MFKSGVIERPKDTRDIILGKVQASVELPEVYMPDMSWFSRHYQNGLPTCGGHAGSHFKQMVQHYDPTADQSPLSPAYLWKKIKQIDGIRPEDGTSSIAIFKALQKSGIADYYSVYEAVNQPLAQYTDPSSINPEIDEQAQIRRDEAYAFVSVPDFEDIKQAIYKNHACILILRGDDGFWRNTEPTFNSIKWGHFVVAYGWDADGIWIVDSAEKDDKYGFKHINKKYFPSHFCPELSTSIDASDALIKNLTSQIKLLRQVASLYAKLKDLKKIQNDKNI